MPGPFLPDPTPAWLKPENASVTDSALTKAMRMIGSLIGADNPTAQVFGLMMTEIPGGSPTGGLAKAVAGLKERVIKAYHGSPHDFERFSLEKIGTGEGAQAYGHGLYFAENEAVAKDYRNALSAPVLKLRDKPIPPPVTGRDFLKLTDDQVRDEAMQDLIQSAHKSMAWPHTVEDVVKYATGEARVMGNRSGDKAYWQSVEQRIKDVAPQLRVYEGKMYEVAIHADPEDFLDWDKPLSQQSEKVKAKLKEFGFEDWKNTPISQTKQSWDASSMRGESMYRAVAEDAPVSDTGLAQSKAAEMLKQKGIPGIKYLDQGSRAAGEGSRNYVVFDDRLIDILKKYGLLLPAAGAATEGQSVIQSRDQP